MKCKLYLIKIFIFAMAMIILKPALLADGQSWLNNSATIRVAPRLSLKLTNESRFDEVFFSGLFLRNWQAGGAISLPSNFYLAGLYKREGVDKPEFVLYENRYTLEAGWGGRLSGIFNLDWRFRTEIRNFAQNLSENHLRLRFRLRIRTRFRIGKIQFKPFIATEPFADNLQKRIFRNRFYLGTAVVLARNIDLIINYIRQDTRNKETIHILNSGFDIKF
ncbi:DUF2490 domain-containing protein [Acidobacteriota bacterium]